MCAFILTARSDTTYPIPHTKHMHRHKYIEKERERQTEMYAYIYRWPYIRSYTHTLTKPQEYIFSSIP